MLSYYCFVATTRRRFKYLWEKQTTCRFSSTCTQIISPSSLLHLASFIIWVKCFNTCPHLSSIHTADGAHQGIGNCSVEARDTEEDPSTSDNYKMYKNLLPLSFRIISLPELKLNIDAGSIKALRAGRVLRPLKLVSGIPSMFIVYDPPPRSSSIGFGRFVLNLLDLTASSRPLFVWVFMHYVLNSGYLRFFLSQYLACAIPCSSYMIARSLCCRKFSWSQI